MGRIFGIFAIALAMRPVFAEPPVIATKGYIDSGISHTKDYAGTEIAARIAGFATTAQGAAADSVQTALTTNNTISKANDAYQKPSGGIPDADLASSFLKLSGGTMTGIVNMGAQKITGLASPAYDSDAATKSYADSKIGAGTSSATFRGDISISGNAGGAGYWKLLTIQTDRDHQNHQSTAYFVFDFAWDGTVELFIPWFNYTANILTSSKYGVRKMPGGFNSRGADYDFQLRFFKKNPRTTEVWLYAPQINARALMRVDFVSNGSIPPETITLAPDFGTSAARKTAWPAPADGYAAAFNACSTSIAPAGGTASAAMSYSTSW
jgi:hypothetical protein